MKKILILSHEATLTGAPLFLLRLVNYLNSTKEYQIMILFKNSGLLLKDFEMIAKTMVRSNLNVKSNHVMKTIIRFFPAYKIRDIIFYLRIRFFKPDIIISNTLGNSDLIQYVKKFSKLKVITIVHEMSLFLNQAKKLSLFDVNKSISITSHFVAVSNSVKNTLCNDFSINKAKISMIYNNNLDFNPQNISESVMSNWKKDNNIPENSFIVGSCGNIIWRKGTDIFISILKRFRKKYPNQKIFFLWQGGNEKSTFFMDIQNEINHLSLNENITLLPFSKNNHFFYNAIDVYISTAREEPFGLTLLEAGAYQKPCIAFEKSGGPEEILSNHRGILIPYGAFDKAAEAIFELIYDKNSSKEFSLALGKFVQKINSENTFLNYKKIIDSFIA